MDLTLEQSLLFRTLELEVARFTPEEARHHLIEALKALRLKQDSMIALDQEGLTGLMRLEYTLEKNFTVFAEVSNTDDSLLKQKLLDVMEELMITDNLLKQVVRRKMAGEFLSVA